MSAKKELQQCWKYVLKTIRNKNSFDLGFLHQICNILLSQQILLQDAFSADKQYNSSNCQTDFVNSVINFLQQLLQKPRKSQQFQSQHIALIVLDSIIFNLYARSKNMDKLRLNNSFYNNSVSMSASQMSDQWSQHNSVVNNNQGELKLALMYIEGLATNTNFFKKLKILYDRTQNKNKNHHYLEILLETMEYFLNKQKLTAAKQTFLIQKNINFKSFINSQGQGFAATPQIFQQINSGIFTNQLNKVVNILSASSQQVLYSLNRIYFVNKKSQQRKHFRGIKFNAQDMVYNLCKLYVESFNTKMNMFEQSKNPLFLWMKNYLVSFYLPVFKKWSQLICELGRQDHGSMISFYKVNEQSLQKFLLLFIDQLPIQLVDFLNMLYRHIQKHSSGLTPSQKFISPITSQQSIHSNQAQTISSITPVKRFFIYSFLGELQLIKQHIFSSQQQGKQIISIEKFQEISNYVINLFFSSSAKKYANSYTPHQLSILLNLSHTIQQKLDQKIIQYDQSQLYYDINDQSQSQLSNYFIDEPILNCDYQILYKRINEIEFTPKDLKQFDIKKDFIFGSKEMLGYKQGQDDCIKQIKGNVNNRYMRKDYQQNYEESEQKKYNKRQHPLSPTKIHSLQDKDEHINQKTFYQAGLKEYNATTEGFYGHEPNTQEQVDFLTWMTIGGNHNYKQKISASKIKLSKTMNLQNNFGNTQNDFAPDRTTSFIHKKSVVPSILEPIQVQNQVKKKKCKQFKTFNKDKVKQINRLYEEYACKNLFI